jgi:hypothetical protein
MQGGGGGPLKNMEDVAGGFGCCATSAVAGFETARRWEGLGLRATVKGAVAGFETGRRWEGLGLRATVKGAVAGFETGRRWGPHFAGDQRRSQSRV